MDGFDRLELSTETLRDLTRDDLRGVISRGLEQTRGSYKLLVQLFNLILDRNCYVLILFLDPL